MFRVKRQGRFLARLIRSNLRPDPDRHAILFIIPWMVVGGADKVNLDLATHLNKALFSLHFLTTSPSDNPWTDRFAEFSQNLLHLPQLLYPENYQHFLLSYIGLAHIKTVLISNSLVGYQAAAAIKQHYPEVQVVDLLHGEGGQQERGGFPRLSHPYEAHLDDRIVVTAYLRDLLLREYRIDASRITVIRNGIDAVTLVSEGAPDWRDDSRRTTSVTTSAIRADSLLFTTRLIDLSIDHSETSSQDRRVGMHVNGQSSPNLVH